MASLNPSLIVVTAEVGKESQSQREVRIHLMEQAGRRKWEVLPLRRTVTIGYEGKAAGRKVSVLTPQDARELYRAAHNGPLAILGPAAYHIRPDPSVNPAPDRALWKPDEFFRYKAHTDLIRSTRHVEEALDSSSAALKNLSCNGFTDPRTLPMHVFSPIGHKHDLTTPFGINNFKKIYGSAHSRTDSSGRVWTKGANHGREILKIAGHELPMGFHWDVNLDRGRRSCTIANGWQVWKLEARAAYVNISPNAAIRQGNLGVLRWSQ